MPLEVSDFPEEVQVAFFMYDLLSDVWDGMNGTFMGKDWSHAAHLFELYEVDNPKETMYFAKTYERILMKYMAEKQEKKRKAEERKAKTANGGGKNYTHNIRG